MPEKSPLHSRTAPLCKSLRWKDWAGTFAVCSYDTVVDGEYYALRQAAGLLDVSPLYKYELRGREAAEFLAWIWARDARRLRPGRVVYGCWCDERGKVVDDGTLACLAPDHYRMTSADPTLGWLLREARGFEVEIEDVSESLAALALQGPTSRAILDELCEGTLGELKFFGVRSCSARGIDFDLSRTGFTGDLGFELWVAADRAPLLWDAVMEAGEGHGLLPVGLDALDISRVEAGFILGGVDYTSSRSAWIESQCSTPSEIGLAWTVQTEREPFIGQAALRREAREGSRHALVGLEIDWVSLEELYERHGLPPQLPTAAWRDPVPVYEQGRQIGRATSGSWSPTLKKNLALATIETRLAETGTVIDFEVTVEYERHRIPATVIDRPFFDPARKKG